MMANIHLLTLSLLSVAGVLNGAEDCMTEGDIRLVDGNHQLEGRLEVCFRADSGELVWGNICTTDWDQSDTTVACRQLGVSEENITQAVFGVLFVRRSSITVPIHWSNTNCSGHETHLVNCSRTLGSCTRDTIGLICNQPNPECTQGDVRIVDAAGSTSLVGRVEFCGGGRWGSVCNIGWDNIDAAVVCRQLGIQEANVPRAITASPAADNVPISLDFLHCNEVDTRLDECLKPDYVEECTHVNDAGVNCSMAIECNEEYGVRLVDGNDSSEGRVQVCRDGLWVSVCWSSWDHNDAQVVCRQLGYVGVALAEIMPDGSTEGRNREFVNLVNCNGNESALSDCHIGGSCLHGIGAAVRCFNESECDPFLEVRLSGGVFSNDMGTVELCYGAWGYVCGNSWDDNDAQVVCQQLGLTGGVAYPSSPFVSEVETLNFNVDNVECSGGESSLDACGNRGFGIDDCQANQGNKAAVVCGTTRGAQLSQCTLEQINDAIETNETSIQVGGLGRCERYEGLSSMCNSVLNGSTNYVFISDTLNQGQLSEGLDRILSENILEPSSDMCREMLQRVVCHYFLPSCGMGGVVYRPRGVCHEECSHVQHTCSREWLLIGDIVEADPTLDNINCSATPDFLGPLATCCTGAGVEIPDPTIETTVFTGGTMENIIESDSNNLVVTVISIVMSLVALILIIVITAVVILLYLISTKRKKVSLRKLQLSILSNNSMRSSTDTRSPTYYGIDDNGKPLRYNGSISRGPLAMPNPYSNQREMEFHSSSQQEPGLMAHISSAIMRELTSNLLIPQSHLRLLDCVGHGEFGVVYKAHYTTLEGDQGFKTSIMAVKTLKGVFDQIQVDKIMEESIKMKNFDHPNVLSLVGVCLDAGPAPYVVMPYMANGSLLHYLKKERRNLVLPVDTDEDIKFEVCKRLVVMCMQIACGMEYLAHEKFVHRDLAARNCMIDIHFVIKIADFGLSEDMYAKNYYRQDETDKSAKLPVKWMAPESLSDGLFSEKSDVWSYGVTCWEVFSGGKTPYPGLDPVALSRMLETEKRLSKPLNTACPEEMYKLMRQCWNKSAERRPTFGDLVEVISDYAEKIAGYLDINNYNPFTATYEEIKPPDDEQAPDHTKQSLGNQLTPCNSARASPHPSPSSPYFTPRGSPRTSPISSPTRYFPNVPLLHFSAHSSQQGVSHQPPQLPQRISIGGTVLTSNTNISGLGKRRVSLGTALNTLSEVARTSLETNGLNGQRRLSMSTPTTPVQITITNSFDTAV